MYYTGTLHTMPHLWLRRGPCHSILFFWPKKVEHTRGDKEGIVTSPLQGFSIAILSESDGWGEGQGKG